MTARRKQLRSNRVVERAAVNAARSLFEAASLVFQEVDHGNDYGKDAYLDLTDRNEITGTCIALQIKGGQTYRTGDGYCIPFDEATATFWARSSLPVFGIVHDPADGTLHWCNLTRHARTEWSGAGGGSVPIPRRPLDDDTLSAFLREAHAYVQASTSSWSLGLLDADETVQASSVVDAFALGRSDPRALLLLRMCLCHLATKATRLAIHYLSHATPHPDIGWTEANWIPSPVKDKIAASFRWTPEELVHMLEAVEFDEFERGGLGESAFMLLTANERSRGTLRQVACGTADLDVRFTALYLLLYLAGREAPALFNEISSVARDLLDHPLADALTDTLGEWGYVTLF
jgi:hypothetical protein